MGRGTLPNESSSWYDFAGLGSSETCGNIDLNFPANLELGGASYDGSEMSRLNHLRLFTVLAGLLWLALGAGARAQEDFSGPELFPDFSLGGLEQDSGQPDQWSAKYWSDDAGRGRLEVEVQLAPSWHVYSLTQMPGGPSKTTLRISTPGVTATAAFEPSEPPLKSVSSVFKGVTIEEHEGRVSWSAPISLPAGFSDSITVNLDAQVCKTGGACIPIRQELTAVRSGPLSQVVAADSQQGSEKKQPPAKPAGKPFRDGDYVVEWYASVEPATLPPGGRGVLRFTAKPDTLPDTYHVYHAAVDDAESSTNFVVTRKDGLRVGAPVTNSPVVSKKLVPTDPPIQYHHGNVTWTLPFAVPEDASAGEHIIEGMVVYQACTENSCRRPMAFKFTAKVMVAAQGTAVKSSPIVMASTKYVDVLDAAATTKWVDQIETAAVDSASEESLEPTAAPADPSQSGAPPTVSGDAAAGGSSLAGLLVFALIGGLILNFMPCVLPVVGLKVMSFVKQAGEDRSRVFWLNVVYACGILSIFLVLALLAVMLNFNWGEQFTYFGFKLGLTLLVFALALSYLGVWEIPAPSFAASSKSQELEGREGYSGAFAKGAFATVLSTPCSGPLLGYMFGTTIGLSAWQTMLVMMTVGVGMAMPYLIIGARPELVSWLPKPGAWMETLKEFLAFLFLGTVAFFFYGFADEQKVAVFVSLIGVWFGCWIIGKVPNWETVYKRLAAWSAGISSAALISLAAFYFLVPGESTLKWVDYDEARLAQLQREGRTVMIDFTADWCVNCIVNYQVAIDTEPTRELIEELDAVPMIADWSDNNDLIRDKLNELRSRSIPVLAIYPGTRPNEPIILRDLVSQARVLEALRQAGPSVDQSSAQAGSSGSTSFASKTH